MNLTVLSTLVRDFASWMDHIREYMFRRAAPAHALGPLMPLLFNYLGRAVRRLDTLTLLWERDQLPTAPLAPRSGSTGAVAAEHTRSATPTPKLRLPTSQNWLVKRHQPFVLYQGAVQRLLDDPDTRALHAAAPQAGRILRPLCRIFGVAVPTWLRLPKRPRKPRPRPAPKPPRLRQTPARGFTRAQIDRMTAADLLAHYGRLPPHFPLPIPNLNHIRRKIAAG